MMGLAGACWSLLELVNNTDPHDVIPDCSLTVPWGDPCTLFFAMERTYLLRLSLFLPPT